MVVRQLICDSEGVTAADRLRGFLGRQGGVSALGRYWRFASGGYGNPSPEGVT